MVTLDEMPVLALDSPLNPLLRYSYLEGLGRRAMTLREREARREIQAEAAADIDALFPERF